MLSASPGRTVTPGAPRERATPATVRGCSEALNSSTARDDFISPLVGTAWSPRRRVRPHTSQATASWIVRTSLRVILRREGTSDGAAGGWHDLRQTPQTAP